VRLLVDEMWPTTLAVELRRRSHDVVAVRERPDLAHSGDDVVFDHAGKEGRVVFTENVPDFVPLATGALSTGATFPGLLLTSNTTWPRGNPRTLGRVVRALDAFLAEPDAVVPGTKMVFWGLRPDQRHQVIAYLEAASE
jgi:predicted nuclease of predicted toxin-antitoxin system